MENRFMPISFLFPILQSFMWNRVLEQKRHKKGKRKVADDDNTNSETVKRQKQQSSTIKKNPDQENSSVFEALDRLIASVCSFMAIDCIEGFCL